MSGMPQLDTSTYSSQVFWFIISFALLYFVIKKSMIKVSVLQEERASVINSGYNGALSCTQVLYEKNQENLRALEKVQRQAEQIRDEAVEQSKKHKELIRETVLRELDVFDSIFHQEWDENLESLRAEMKDLAMQLASIYYQAVAGRFFRASGSDLDKSSEHPR